MKASSSVLFFARSRISCGAPCAMTLPSSIAASQSNRLASSMYAVATITLMSGRRARIESISSQNCRRESGSTPVVGSSRIRRSGSCISEQQRLTFCFMPPESLPQGRSGNGSSPVAFRSSSMRARRSAAPWPNKRPKKSMLS